MIKRDPHASFNDAWRFLAQYFEQVSRLLLDAGSTLERSGEGWRRVRPVEDEYATEFAPLVGDSERWLPSHLYAFYAPAGQLQNNWGNPAEDIPRVAFIGVELGPPSGSDPPWLTLGWFENHGLTGIIEQHLRVGEDNLYAFLDPEGLEVFDGPQDALGFPWPQPSGFVDNWGAGELRMSMAAVPLSLIRSGADLARVMDRFVAALEG